MAGPPPPRPHPHPPRAPPPAPLTSLAALGPLAPLAQQPLAWNHLQVPNYYSRQPQVAHMSSDRLSHSPLTWHTPTPPDHQNMKGAPNLYQRTPPPSEAPVLKGNPNPLYRHTPTPPDRDSMKGYRHTPTPPDLKSSSNPLYRHTPTPPEIHGMKGNVPMYRHTPPPDGHKSVTNPLFNLQQMITDRNVVHAESLRDNLIVRNESMGLSRLSPGLAVGSMDLSVTRSPRNGNQNGDLGIPMSLSVRDTTKINSLDSMEITKIHQVPPYISKDPSKATSPNVFNQNVNSPNSPKSAKRPVKKVDSILERLNSGTDGVVITPVQLTPSPHSVIVSAHMLEDSNSRGSSSSYTPVINQSSTEITLVEKPPPVEAPEHPLALHPVVVKEPIVPESLSVIKESPLCTREDSQSNYSNDDSSNDSNKSKHRRKQLKTTKIDSEISEVKDFSSISSVKSDKDVVQEPDNSVISEAPVLIRESPHVIVNNSLDHVSSSDTPVNLDFNKPETSVEPVVQPRKESSSESETIDDIAAMIASTNSDKADIENNDSNNFELSSKPLTENLNQILSSPVNTVTESDEKQADSEIPEQPSVVDSTEENLIKKPKDPSFVEVENELEKMFAGIEESANIVSTSTDQVDSVTATKSSGKPGKKRAYRKSSDAASSGLLSSDENTPKKKQKLTKRKNSKEKFDVEPHGKCKAKKTKLKGLAKGKAKLDALPTKDAYDSGSNASSSKSRGPYVQIKGPRDSPLSVNIINTPIQEDDVVKPLQKIKTMKGKASLAIDNNFKAKVKSKGLHSSTLSMKYDATTTDTSWICVFCKKGPHTGLTAENSINGNPRHMGDLFGPYIISTDCPDYQHMMSDPYDTLFKGQLKKESFLQSKQSTRGKRLKSDDSADEKTHYPNEEMYIGMTEAAVNSFEVWLHEDCAVWAPGLYLVGAKLVGLESAVWTCCTMRCDLCSFLGATVACIKRGCTRKMHVNCARADMWTLSEDNFLVYCREHGLP